MPADRSPHAPRKRKPGGASRQNPDSAAGLGHETAPSGHGAPPASGSGRPSSGLETRAVALDALDLVLEQRQPLDQVIEKSASFAALDDRDRRFAHLVVLTTIRRLGEIDRAISTMLARPLPKRARIARMILRLGLAQILFLATPPHAAVDTAVRLARTMKQDAYAKLINAALRRAIREAAAGAAPGRVPIIAPIATPEVNTPAWLWARWVSAYGAETASRIARAHGEEPPLDITVKSEPARWAGLLNADILPTGSLRRRGGGKISDLPGFHEGAWWVQDVAATLPAKLLGPLRGQRVIDLCAAPGGKTAQLSALGAHVVAVERDLARAERLRQNMTRLSLAAEVVVADGLSWSPGFLADAVLLDAPCTATGTIRRHPDVAWIKRPEDIATLARTQAALLSAAADMVAPGGCLVYCACSLEPEEGRDQARSFLATRPGFVAEPVEAAEIGGLAEGVDADGWLRTLPCRWADAGGMDGFFAARFRRRGR